jgi:hypothetical protein
MVFVLAGCKERPVRVEIAPGYSGPVMIGCGSMSNDFETIIVDSTGQAESPRCPTHRVDLLIVRDGKRIFAEGPIKWESTGDKIPVSIQFTIH